MSKNTSSPKGDLLALLHMEGFFAGGMDMAYSLKGHRQLEVYTLRMQERIDRELPRGLARSEQPAKDQRQHEQQQGHDQDRAPCLRAGAGASGWPGRPRLTVHLLHVGQEEQIAPEVVIGIDVAIAVEVEIPEGVVVVVHEASWSKPEQDDSP